MNKRKAQIWVETVIYTLVGIAIIAVALAIITPKINEFRDKAVIEQTINSLKAIDSRIDSVVSGGNGNVRIVEFRMKKGEFYVDKEKETIYYVLKESRSVYSEPGEKVNFGRIEIMTEKEEGSKNHKVSLTLNYSSFDIDFSSEEENPWKIFESTTPYKLRFENAGLNEEEKIKVLFDVVSG